MLSRNLKHTIKTAIALCGVVFWVMACSGGASQQSDSGSPSSESLLAAKDDAKETLSPLEMHAAAKKRVVASQTRGKLSYTKHVNLDDIMGTERVRVLRLTPEESLASQSSPSVLPDDIIPPPPRKPGSDLYQTSSVSPSVETKQNTMDNNPNIRIGDYGDKTRLVFDLPSETKFDYYMNNQNTILTVTLGSTGWQAQAQRTFETSSLVQSYRITQSTPEQTIVEFEFKKPLRMVNAGRAGPNQNRGHRIFFDVAAF
jgi:hypothetical protein